MKTGWNFTLMTMALVLAGCGAGDRTNEQDGTDGRSSQAGAVADKGGRPTAFARCATCHQTAPGRNGVGPSLAGVYGAPAGHEPTYAYSKALRNSGLVWNAETLDAYLADPRGIVPGTKMAFAGVRSAEERAALVAYLETL